MIGSNLIIQYMCFRPVKRGDETVYPIGLAISRRNLFIDLVLQADKNKDTEKMYGFNGAVSSVFDLPQVVKKLYSQEYSNNYSSEREIKALTALEVNDIIHPGIQHGMFGYKNKDGDTYIVSQKIEGKSPNVKTNPFNEKNLEYLINIISKLDRPDKYWNPKYPHNLIHPICLPMHYDLKTGNILISKDTAGIIDFEYLDFIKLFPSKSSKQNKNWGIIVNYSDIKGIPSNLRNFEYRILLPYLEKCENPKEIFKKYLEIKGKYYERISEEYNYLPQCIQDNLLIRIMRYLSGQNKKCKEISKNQKIIANALTNADDNIIKSEAIKIQIARFIYLLSTKSHGDKTFINPKQIRNYIINADNFFREMIKTSQLHKEYYKTCIELISEWKKIVPLIDSQKEKEVLNYYKDISGISDSTNNNKLFFTIYTDEEQKTLDTLIL